MTSTTTATQPDVEKKWYTDLDLHSLSSLNSSISWDPSYYEYWHVYSHLLETSGLRFENVFPYNPGFPLKHSQEWHNNVRQMTKEYQAEKAGLPKPENVDGDSKRPESSYGHYAWHDEFVYYDSDRQEQWVIYQNDLISGKISRPTPYDDDRDGAYTECSEFVYFDHDKQQQWITDQNHVISTNLSRPAAVLSPGSEALVTGTVAARAKVTSTIDVSPMIAALWQAHKTFQTTNAKMHCWSSSNTPSKGFPSYTSRETLDGAIMALFVQIIHVPAPSEDGVQPPSRLVHTINTLLDGTHINIGQTGVMEKQESWLSRRQTGDSLAHLFRLIISEKSEELEDLFIQTVLKFASDNPTSERAEYWAKNMKNFKILRDNTRDVWEFARTLLHLSLDPSFYGLYARSNGCKLAASLFNFVTILFEYKQKPLCSALCQLVDAPRVWGNSGDYNTYWIRPKGDIDPSVIGKVEGHALLPHQRSSSSSTTPTTPADLTIAMARMFLSLFTWNLTHSQTFQHGNFLSRLYSEFSRVLTEIKDDPDKARPPTPEPYPGDDMDSDDDDGLTPRDLHPVSEKEAEDLDMSCRLFYSRYERGRSTEGRTTAGIALLPSELDELETFVTSQIQIWYKRARLTAPTLGKTQGPKSVLRVARSQNLNLDNLSNEVAPDITAENVAPLGYVLLPPLDPNRRVKKGVQFEDSQNIKYY